MGPLVHPCVRDRRPSNPSVTGPIEHSLLLSRRLTCPATPPSPVWRRLRTCVASRGTPSFSSLVDRGHTIPALPSSHHLPASSPHRAPKSQNALTHFVHSGAFSSAAQCLGSSTFLCLSSDGFQQKQPSTGAQLCPPVFARRVRHG